MCHFIAHDFFLPIESLLQQPRVEAVDFVFLIVSLLQQAHLHHQHFVRRPQSHSLYLVQIQRGVGLWLSNHGRRL